MSKRPSKRAAAVSPGSQVSNNDESNDESVQHFVDSLSPFWQEQLRELNNMDAANVKHQLPLARIKKIMRADEDVRMVSAEAPVVFAKACELFILDITMRAWANANEQDRRTLQQSDIVAAIKGHEVFDFLSDILPSSSTAAVKKEGGKKRRNSVSSQASGLPQVQQQQQQHQQQAAPRPAKKARSAAPPDSASEE